MMLTIVPFEMKHLEDMGLEIPAWHRPQFEQSQAWTMMVDGRAIGAAGLLPLWPGVAEAWQITREEWRHYARVAACQIRRRLRAAIQDMKLHRVQAACLNEAGYWYWLRLFGFRLEGTMKGYGINGEDYLRLAWVRPWQP